MNLRKELKIEFVNEEKINDAGGLLREWVHIVSSQITDPSLGLFKIGDTSDIFYKWDISDGPIPS